MPSYRFREAADLLGVSDDTVRRWASPDGWPPQRCGRAPSRRRSGARPVRRAQRRRRAGGGPVTHESARNRFVGLVTRVVRDTVMAQVELQCGPYRVVSLMSREAADELGLQPGVRAIASVKSTNVVVEVSGPAGDCRMMRSPRLARSPAPPCSRRRVAAARRPAARRRAGSAAAVGLDHRVRGVVADRGVHQAWRAFEKAHSGTKVTFSFDASSALATEITQGHKADVFASASGRTWIPSSRPATREADQLRQQHHGDRDAAGQSGQDQDRRRPGQVRGEGRTVRCRRPVRRDRAEGVHNAKVTVNPVSREADVKSTLGKVEIKEVDAGVVYVTDVRAAGAKVTGVAIPAEVNASTAYPIACSRRRRTRRWRRPGCSTCCRPTGQKALRAAGFSGP